MRDFPSVTVEQWRQRVEEELGGAEPETLARETVERIVLEPLYAESRPDVAGFPGVWPFVRGSRPLPQEPPWVVCQAVSDPDLDIAAAQVEADRRGGVRGIWLRLDRCARLGLAPDSEAADGGCGVEGLAAYDATDLAAVLGAAADGPLSLRLEAGGNALPAAALLSVALETSGRDPGQLDVHLGMDPLGALAADGALPAPAEDLAGEAALLARCGDRSGPWSRSITVSSLPYARAGAHAVQVLALSMATAIQYLRWLEEHGVEPRAAAPQIDFVFAGDRDLLLDVCKLRAARSLWARIQLACGLRVRPPWIHAVTGWRTLTRADPWTNMLRATVQCAAAVLGGADAITTLPFDAPLGRSEDLGRRVARNTQAILAEECGLGSILDAGGGAHAIESLTADLARRAWELLQNLESSGGLLACLRDGQVHTMLEDTVRKRAARATSGDDPVLGVSVHPPGEDTAPRRQQPDLDAVRERLLERVRRRRQGAPEIDLESLSAAGYDGEGGARMWEALVDAARSGATIAELSAELRSGSPRRSTAALARSTDEDLAIDAAEAAGGEAAE